MLLQPTDTRWDPVTGRLDAGSVPPNFSPGVMPVMRQLIAQDRKCNGVTVRQAVHIKGAWGFDGSELHTRWLADISVGVWISQRSDGNCGAEAGGLRGRVGEDGARRAHDPAVD